MAAQRPKKMANLPGGITFTPSSTPVMARMTPMATVNHQNHLGVEFLSAAAKTPVTKLGMAFEDLLDHLQEWFEESNIKYSTVPIKISKYIYSYR